MRRCLVLAVLGNVLDSAGAIKDAEPIPESWCITYLSTYLAPVSVKTDGPVLSGAHTDALPPSLIPPSFASSGISFGTSSTTGPQLPDSTATFSISLDALPSSDVESSSPASTTTTGPDPGGRSIIFQVVPDTDFERRDLSKRALGGFVGGGGVVNPDICDDATAFSLLSGQLLDDGLPIYYNGQAFSPFGAQGQPPDGAVTTTFQNIGGILGFVNASLPNGEAGFCQDPTTGQVYITFSDTPEGCTPVSISVYTVDQCLNGELDARIPPSITTETTESSIASSSPGKPPIPTDTTELVGSSKSTVSSALSTSLSQTRAEASATSTSSLSTSILGDSSSAISQTTLPDDPSFVDTTDSATERDIPTSSSSDVSSTTDSLPTTSMLPESSSIDTSLNGPSTGSYSASNDLLTSGLSTSDSSSEFIEPSSSSELFFESSSTSLQITSTDTELSLSLVLTSDTSFTESSATIASSDPTTESSTDLVESSSIDTTESTEPATSSSEIDTTTDVDTTSSIETTTDVDTTTTIPPITTIIEEPF